MAATLSGKVRNKLKRFVFRRVSSVTNFQLSQIRYYTKPDEYKKIGTIEFLSDQEIEKNVEFRYHDYYGWSSKTTLRKPDAFTKKSIFFEKKYFGIFDPILLQIKPETATQKDVAPPRKGDLLCGVVESSSQGKLYYSQWFICSEQFYRAWTLLMYDTHSAFKKAEQKKCGAKAYWMSGNRLMTNNYIKWLLGCEKIGVVPSDKEQKKRYWHQRCEQIARTWIHVYCALVIIVRYDELPSEFNIPVVRGDESRPYPHWHLPPKFVQLFRDAYK